MDFDLEALDDEDPTDFAEAGADDTDRGVVATATDGEEQTTAIASAYRETGEAKAVQGILVRSEFLRESANTLRDWCASRFTSDRWLDENEREWYALDRVIRSRPWATNKDTPFKYPFREATNEMRQVDGNWVGDEKGRPKDTRGKVPFEMLTQVRVCTLFPPSHRLILFAPEFGSEDSFNLNSWKNIKPDDDVDIWVVCWQGWNDFNTMVREMTLKLASFADGMNTIWYGQGMGAIVAYEVLKVIELTGMENPSLPVALAVADCPAPALFQESYKPYEDPDWSQNLTKLSTDVQGRIMGCVGMMRTYKFAHPKMQSVLHIPIKAYGHHGSKLAPKTAIEGWQRYAKDGDFEMFELDNSHDAHQYLTGQGYNYDAAPKMLETLTAAFLKYERWIQDSKLPDLGALDGPIPEKVDCVVVGAGLSGIYQAAELAKSGKSVLLVERYHALGGVWQYYGNEYSRVNTSEIGYRIVHKTGEWSRPNEDHTPRRDILKDMYSIAAEHCYDMIRTCVNVDKVDKRPDGRWTVHMRNVRDGTESVVDAGLVTLHVNRRIGKKREVDWENSSAFKGTICYGYGNEVRDMDFWGKNVLIVGAGAFAFENVRTALERGARFVTLLGRRDGTTSPKWIDMISFLRPLDDNLMTNRGADMISFDCWQKCYLKAGLKTPSCWKNGLLKPNNHTISVSDLGFIAGFHGMLKLQVGEIERVNMEGTAVVLQDGSAIDCNIIIKCTGFQLNHEVSKITGYTKMHPYGLLDFNLNYSAEPLLDGGQFGSSKDKTDIQVVDQGFTMDEYIKGLEHFKAIGFNERNLAALGNPFGSGNGGPTRMNSKYFAYLANHPDEQEALLKYGGKAEQQITELWVSQIGQYSHITLMRVIAALSKLSLTSQA